MVTAAISRPTLVACVFVASLVLISWLWSPERLSRPSFAADPDQPAQLDPAAWGEDHVDEDIPDYVEGGECLFCHRNEVGLSWSTDRHNRTIHDPEESLAALKALRSEDSTAEIADEVELILGDDRQNCFLKRSDAYGKLLLLSVRADKGRGRRFKLSGDVNDPQWERETFADQCAGCHTTGVDSSDRTFITVGHDCYVCHGDAPLEHANEPELMPLAEAREDEPRVVISICGSCHIRFGRSRSTGLPYPNNFVAGDNLFRDFEVDFSKADDPAVNPSDRHVMENVRDVVLNGNTELTCLSCHEVHGNSTEKHRKLADGQSCVVCHDPTKSKKSHRKYEVHSEVCGY